MRIARALALAGIDSRRKCEEIVSSGLVTVNGKIVRNLAQQVDTAVDDVRIRGSRVKPQQRVFYLLHKPVGYTTTVSDRFAKKTVFELLPRKLGAGNRGPAQHTRRVFSVGRLDRDSSGLLLFTNDGEMSNRLLHPRYGVSKWYAVVLDKPLTVEAAQKLMRGVFLEEGKARAEKVKGVGRKKISLMIREGKKREVRRICRKVGFKVLALHRTSFGSLKLGSLTVGQGRFLTDAEVRELEKDTAGPPPPAKRAPTRPARKA